MTQKEGLKLKKEFTRREAIWIGAIGLAQLGILSSAAAGWWNLKPRPDRPQINLTELHSPPSKEQYQSGLAPLKIAVASVISPMENVNLYGDLLNQIGERVNMNVEMVQRENYSETNRLVDSGEVQIAFICSGALLGSLKPSQGQEILATPQIAGSTTYRSYIVVPASSDAESILDLRGKSFAYMDPLSYSGRIAPQYMVKQLGYNPEKFFGKTLYTYSHDKSIRAVADGIVEGAAVDSLIYDLTVAKDDGIRGKIKVIDQSEEVGNPPIIVSNKTDKELIARLKNTLMTMHMDEEGREAMALLHFDRFVHPDSRLYDRVWEMAREVGLSQ